MLLTSAEQVQEPKLFCYIKSVRFYKRLFFHKSSCKYLYRRSDNIYKVKSNFEGVRFVQADKNRKPDNM